MNLLIIGLFIFISIHILLRLKGFRPSIEGKIGKIAFRAVFSIFAIIGLVIIIKGYAQYRPIAPVFYEATHFGKGMNYLFTYIAFVLMLSKFLGGKIKAYTQHPQLLAVNFWAIGHIFANGDLASLLLFGGFFLWSMISRIMIGAEIRIPTKWGRGDEGSLAFGALIWFTFAKYLHGLWIGMNVLG